MKFKGLILISFLGIATIFTSCKKGANDPSFSFSSRDARITADWVLTSMTKTSYTSGLIYTSTTTYDFDGTTMTEKSENGFGTQTTSYPYAYELTINKEGDYKKTVTDDGNKSEYTDYWFWANSDKSKIAVTFSGTGTYMINRLAKDELVLTQSNTSVNTDSDGNVSTVKVNLTMTFNKK